jgi:hypothetical protein
MCEKVWVVFVDSDDYEPGTLIAVCATPERAAAKCNDLAGHGFGSIDVIEEEVLS